MVESRTNIPGGIDGIIKGIHLRGYLLTDIGFDDLHAWQILHVILTAGCAKYRYNKLPLGDIGGIPRVIDAGQCNDCYSLVVIANALAEAFGTDVNGLPLSFNISWYEQKAVLVLLALLKLGVKDIMLGPRLPVFLSPGVTGVLVDTFGIKLNNDVAGDMKILQIE